MKKYIRALALLAASVAIAILSAAARPEMEQGDPLIRYQDAIRKTAAMAHDPHAQQLARRFGLQVMNLTWEDTGRYKSSSVGPNISDMTIQVLFDDQRTRGRHTMTCMPVIRYPNFEDRSCDLDPRDFTVMTGNQFGRPLKRASLYDVLQDPGRFLSNPSSWKGGPKSLLAPRDEKVLVSAQACFLPIPQTGKATFNPVLFNYQSVFGDPAVLTLLATREGTSITTIDNKRDTFEHGGLWGQRLFHNVNGQRASLTGQRQSEYTGDGPNEGPKARLNSLRAETGLNMVLLVQIPLKQKKPMRFQEPIAELQAAPGLGGNAKRTMSDVENAVIGHGDLEGPFAEIGDLNIERDTRFPIRVTVQFYKATSNGVVSEADMRSIKEQIGRVYAQSDYVGSLVTEGDTGRVTEYESCKIQPLDWWDKFWNRYEANTGVNRDTARKWLREKLGPEYWTRPVCDLYVRNVLKEKRFAGRRTLQE